MSRPIGVARCRTQLHRGGNHITSLRQKTLVTGIPLGPQDVCVLGHEDLEHVLNDCA